jgi:hypothetical protein
MKNQVMSNSNTKAQTNNAADLPLSKEQKRITLGAIVFFSTVFAAIGISIFFIVHAPHTATGPLAFFSVTLKIPLTKTFIFIFLWLSLSEIYDLCPQQLRTTQSQVSCLNLCLS